MSQLSQKRGCFVRRESTRWAIRDDLVLGNKTHEERGDKVVLHLDVRWKFNRNSVVPPNGQFLSLEAVCKFLVTRSRCMELSLLLL